MADHLSADDHGDRLIGSWRGEFSDAIHAKENQSCDSLFDLEFRFDDTLVISRSGGNTERVGFSIDPDVNNISDRQSVRYQIVTASPVPELNAFTYLCEDRLYLAQTLFGEGCEFGLER